MTNKTTRWETGSPAYFVTVSTPQLPNETEAAWQARHDANVAAMQAQFPEN